MLASQTAFVESMPMLAQTIPTHPFSSPSERPTLPTDVLCRIHRGHILFDPTNDSSAFHLIKGEIVIFSNGRPVDLVEAGEYVDTRMWADATAVAQTDCTLRM